MSGPGRDRRNPGKRCGRNRKKRRDREKREREEKKMAMDRIMCRQCGNADADKLDFTPDKRHVYCHICRAVTPLYNNRTLVEIEGVQSLEERLENADQLIALGQYATAEEKYRELVADYSGDYRTWLGLARAESRDFTGELFDWEALNNAKRVSEASPETAGKLDMLMRHCREIEGQDHDIRDKTRGNQVRIGKMQAAQDSAETGKPELVKETPVDNQIAESENYISKSETNLRGKNLFSWKSLILFGALGAGSIWLYKRMVYQFTYYDGSEWLCLLTFLLMIAMCGLLLIVIGGFLLEKTANIAVRGAIRKERRRLKGLRQEAEKVHRQQEREYEQKMAAYREYQAGRRAEAEAIRREVDAVQESISALEHNRKMRVDAIHNLISMLSTGT